MAAIVVGERVCVAREEVGDGYLACALGYFQGGAIIPFGVGFDPLTQKEADCFNMAAKNGAVQG